MRFLTRLYSKESGGTNMIFPFTN